MSDKLSSILISPRNRKKINIIKKVTSNNLLYIIPNILHNFNLEMWHLMHCQMPQGGKGFLTASLRLLIGNWFHEHLQSDEITFPIYIWNVYLRNHIDLLGRIQSCQVFHLFLEKSSSYSKLLCTKSYLWAKEKHILCVTKAKKLLLILVKSEESHNN